MSSRWLFGCLVVGACSSSGDDPVATRACDPLSVEAPPISLGELVGAGRASNGTTYVIDRADPANLRGFISEGNLLRRRTVDGWGEGPGSVIATMDVDLQIRIELAGGAPQRMAIFRGPQDPATKSFDIDTQGELLALVAASDLSGLTLVNISNEHVLYAATTSDGHRLVAFEPTVDLTEDKVRVFYGTPDRMAQRKVLQVLRDSSVHLDFDLDGMRMSAQLDYPNGGNMFGPPRLKPAVGTAIALTPDPGSPGDGWDTPRVTGAPLTPPPRKEPAALVAGLHFICF